MSNEEFGQRVVLVRAYTETRLSFEKDRLIALSGFTKKNKGKARPNLRLGRVGRTCPYVRSCRKPEAVDR